MVNSSIMESQNNVPENAVNIKIEEEEPPVSFTPPPPSLDSLDSVCLICLKSIFSNSEEIDSVEKYLYSRFSHFCIHYLKLDTSLVQVLKAAIVCEERDEPVEIPELFCRKCKHVVRDALKIFEELNEVKIKLLGTVNKLGLAISQSCVKRDCVTTINDEVQHFREQLENNCFTKAQIVQPTIKLAPVEIIHGSPITCKVDRNKISQDDDNDDDELSSADDLELDDDWSPPPSPPPKKRTRSSKTKKVDNKRVTRSTKRKIPLESSTSSTFTEKAENDEIGKPIRSEYFYNCSECKQKFRRRTPFIHHNLEVHEGVDLEKFLECSVCLAAQTDVIALQNHLKSEHECPEKRNIFCVHCTAEAFTTKQLRDLHMLLEHPRCSHILCEVDHCSEKFMSVSDYCNHLQSQHASTDNNSIHCCEQCGRGFLGYYHCELHKLYHTKNEQGLYVCPIQQCIKSNTYKNVSKLINHYNSKHLVKTDQIQLHRCDLCKKSPYFLFRKELSVHQWINHAKEVRCQFCGKTFMGHNALRVHHFNKHPNEFKGNLILSQRQIGLELPEEPPITSIDHIKMGRHVVGGSTVTELDNDELELALYRTCPYCSKKFRTFKAMEKHKASEHNIQLVNTPKQIQCEVCGATLAKSQLSRHLLIHEEPQFSCPYPPCPRKFRREDLMRMHIKKLHDRKESDREFVCDTCGKRYLSAGLLNRHVKEQHMKLYPCHLCSKKFSTLGRTIEHLWTSHTDEKFHCQWCSSEYTWLVKLKAHVKKKHPEEAHLLPNFYSYATKPKTYKCTEEGQQKMEVTTGTDNDDEVATSCSIFINNHGFSTTTT